MILRIKLGYTGLLVLAALVLALNRAVAWWFFAGLVLSWLGDAMLGGLRSLTRRVVEPFLAGMGLFAGAQICYCVGFALYLQGQGAGMEGVLSFLIGYWAIALVVWWLLIGRGNQASLLKGISLGYGLLLMTMGGLACAACFWGGRFVWPLLAGSLLFIFSDSMIALSKFSQKDGPHMDAVVWFSYGPAQLLLLIGAALLR